MATYYFLNTGNTNWGVSTNWSTSSGGPGNGSVPTLSDDTIFDTNSGNCTVDTTNRECKSINFTNYGATISMTYVINTYGDVTLGASMGITGSAQLNVNETSTLTSNGKTWSSDFTFGGNAKTFTLSDDWAVLGIVRIFSGGNTSINSRTFSCLSDLTVSGVYGDTRGTTLFKLAGNGTWSHTLIPTSYLRNDVTIDTPGTISFGANILWGQGTLTHVTGSVVTTGNTLNTSGIGGTFNCSNIQFNNMTLGGGVHTVVGNLDINGLFYINTSSVVNSGNILLGGSVIIQNSRKLTGSTNIVMDGTGTIDMGTANYDENIGISGTFSVNTTGTLTIGSNCKIEADNVIYVTGSVVYNGPLYFQRGYNRTTTQNITWTHKATGAGLAFIGSGVHNLLSNIDCDTDLFVGMLSNTTIIDGYQINIGRSFTCNSTSGVVRGTTKFVLDGTGTVSSIYIGAWRNNTEINTSGTITFTGSVYYDTGTFSYVSGNVITTGSTLRIGANTNLDTNGITWSNAVLGIGLQTITFLSNFNATGNVSSLNNSNVWNGATVSVGGNLTTTTSGQATGTSKIVLNGSGYWEGSFGNNIDINTSGSITFSSVGCGIGCGTLKYISGSVSAHPSNLFWIKLCGTITLNNCGNFNFQNILQEGNTVLTNDINVLGNYSTNYNITLNGGTVSVGGSFYTGGSIFSGNSTIRMVGTGTWSSAGTLTTNLTIDTTGQIGISGTLRYAIGTLKYISGTVSTSGSTLYLTNSSTLDTGGDDVNRINWNNVQYLTVNNCTLLSNLYVNGLFATPQNGGVPTTTTFVGSKNIYCYGGLTHWYGMNGSATIYLRGGTWFCNTAQSLNTFIDGDITLGSTVNFFSGTLTYLSGNVTTTGSYLRIGPGTYNIGPSVTFNDVGTIGTTGTLTLNNVINCLNFIPTSAQYYTFNGSSINVNGNFTAASTGLYGTTNIVLKGTGTFSVPGSILRNPVNIDSNGTVIISGTITYNTGTITYTAGTVSTTGSTLNITGTTTLDTTRSSISFINWSNVNFGLVSGPSTLTTLTELIISGNFNSYSSLGMINGSTISVGGSLTNYQPTSRGTSKFKMTGTGTILSMADSYYFRNDIVVDTPGVITLGNCWIESSTFSVATGSISLTGATFLSNNCTLDFNSNSVDTFVNYYTTQITSPLYCNNYIITASNTLNGLGLYVLGNITVNNSVFGTSIINLIGSGNWSNSSTTGYGIRSTLVLDTTGTINMTSNVQIVDGKFRYVKGNLNTNNYGLILQSFSSTVSIDSTGVTWSDIIITPGTNNQIGLSSSLYSTGTMSITSNNSYAFTGSSGFNVSRLITTSTTNTSLRTITYQSGVTYSVRDNISLISSTNANRLRFISSSSGNRAIFILGKDATQNIGYVNATDIDSNAGQTIWSFGSVLSNTLNWNDLDARSAGGSSTFIH